MKAGVVAWGMLATLGWSQQPAPATATPPKPYVLHVYANLVQVPALILNGDLRPVSGLAKDHIFIRLDSGPAFHPTKMHIEGDEPISLAVLVDASGGEKRLLARLAEDAAKAAEASLTARDRISMFAVDCTLVRVGQWAPATDDNMRLMVHAALSSSVLHGGGNTPKCEHSVHLWDAAAQVVRALSNQPGRKVLLLISSGRDRKSTNTWNALKEYATNQSVAIFGLRDLIHFYGDTGYQGHAVMEAGFYFNNRSVGENVYLALCEGTGGIILTTPANQLAGSMENIVALVRARYILEFPRPDDFTPGKHAIDVTVPSAANYITTAGVTLPLPDAGRESDPTTVPSAPSPAVMGKRRVLSPH
ncbi:hypothetical protein GOB94_03200 [Granulicella sp. 5B5]|uniref:hypothetical protein n=1 Tax=Granulicella sp. 5B5 TaxID=1617967 RepID=UPI0015F55DA5|nr:hypothetical protein [Granulicella sp. 5B5]QMV17814.1 hypothetical protein GOB94_03200 [Granulicella sp. 5B5]